MQYKYNASTRKRKEEKKKKKKKKKKKTKIFRIAFNSPNARVQFLHLYVRIGEKEEREGKVFDLFSWASLGGTLTLASTQLLYGKVKPKRKKKAEFERMLEEEEEEEEEDEKIVLCERKFGWQQQPPFPRMQLKRIRNPRFCTARKIKKNHQQLDSNSLSWSWRANESCPPILSK